MASLLKAIIILRILTNSNTLAILCVTEVNFMIRGTITSIRLSPKLCSQLEKASRKLQRGKNWIINHALEEYLAKLGQQKLMDEAHRQSVLASQKDTKENKPWDEDSDTSGWV